MARKNRLGVDILQMILDPQAGVIASAPERTVVSGMLMTQLPRRQSASPEPAMSEAAQSEPHHGGIFVVTTGLALALQAGLFIASAPWAVLFWGFICAAALATLTFIQLASSNPWGAGDRLAARCALGGFGLAWGAGIIMVGVHLAPETATLFGLGLLVSAGAFTFWVPAGLVNATLLVAPAMLLCCGAQLLGGGAGMGFLPPLGIGAFALTAAVVSGRAASR